MPRAGGDDPRTSVVADRILDVAIEAFGLHSYGEVSVAELCAGAHISKGTFYRHFDSKGQVFVRAAERVVLQSLARFREAIAPRRARSANLDPWVSGWVGFAPSWRSSERRGPSHWTVQRPSNPPRIGPAR